VVLVGGYGTRLRPLTFTTPKQMLPVAHRPMIERVVAHLGAHGVTEAVLSLGYRPDAFLEAYPDGTCAGVNLVYAVEPEPLDTAGAIRFAADAAGIDDTFVVVNGDVITDLDVSQLVEFHRAHDAEGTIHLTRVDDPSAFGVVATDADGRVLRFVEKPPRHEAPSNEINAGTYVLEPSVLARIPTGRRVSVERETFPAIAADGRLYAMATDDYWLDTGTPAQYLRAQLDLLDGVRPSPPEPAVGPGARVVAGATVERSVIGAGATVEEGARVVESVLLPGATVQRDARLHRAIVGHRAVVGAGAELSTETVVGDDTVIPCGATLSGARVPEVEP
jgi:mannose-1-phosphate guanylyltransferase